MTGRGLSVGLAAFFGFCMLTLTAEATGQDCEGVEQASGDGITLALVNPFLGRAIGVTAPASDPDHLYIVQQRGRVRVIDLTTDSLVSTPFLNLQSKVSRSGQELGLLSLAFHPEYETNGYFFVAYTIAEDDSLVVSRFTATSPLVADQASELVIIQIDQPATNNQGGTLAFGPDDHYLYVGLGDGGGDNDPNGQGQNPFGLLGKMIRLDVSNSSAKSPYEIPIDNPFADNPGVSPEIWALGLRNPWAFSFDDETGDLYLPDVGFEEREELNYEAGPVVGGQNFQWKRNEGTRLANPPAFLTFGESTGPVLQYSHTGGAYTGCAIIGGIVYRGCRIPELRGTYFFADHCGEWVRSCRIVDGEVTELRERTVELNASIPSSQLRSISAFGQDASGELYICDDISGTGRLFRVVPRDFNIPPTAVISTDPNPPTVSLTDNLASITLDSRESDDGDGGVQDLTATWEKVEGPAGDTIESPESLVTRIEMSQTGTYSYLLTVSDGTDTDTTTVSVQVVDMSDSVFRRADANGDASIDISDGVAVLQFLFLGVPVGCQDAADSNDSGDVDLTDAVFTFNFLFLGGDPPPPPTGECGEDEAADLLPDCTTPDSCI